ncbi:hypothetical protein BH11ACT6_BH11ACT6_34950 [soil metagenome]
MHELESRPATGPMSGRGFTGMHALLATLIDQIVELNMLTDSYVRANVKFDGEGPPHGKKYVERPPTPIERAKQLKVARERLGLNTWYENLMKGVN